MKTQVSDGWIKICCHTKYMHRYKQLTKQNMYMLHGVYGNRCKCCVNIKSIGNIKSKILKVVFTESVEHYSYYYCYYYKK